MNLLRILIIAATVITASLATAADDPPPLFVDTADAVQIWSPVVSAFLDKLK